MACARKGVGGGLNRSPARHSVVVYCGDNDQARHRRAPTQHYNNTSIRFLIHAAELRGKKSVALLLGTFVLGAMNSYREARRRLRPVRDALRQASSALLRERARRRFAASDLPRSHGLSAPLIVSLTSYPPRFPTL